MDIILLIGAALNCIGGCGILLSMFVKIPFSFPLIPSAEKLNPPDYALFRLFTAGTAYTFASMYMYLYFHTEYAMPFLIFGMALKYWAFLASLVAVIRYKAPKDILVNFGFSNLIVGILFSWYLVSM